MHQLWLLKVSEYVCMYAVCQIILVMSNKLKQINQATITSDHLFCSFLLLFFCCWEFILMTFALLFRPFSLTSTSRAHAHI
jgi:hypothetical protein